MSVEQIEQEIQRLPANELVQLAQWLSRFLASHAPKPTSADEDWPETPELMAELDRRLAEFAANPGIAVPFEPDYFEELKRQLGNERAQKAPAR